MFIQSRKSLGIDDIDLIIEAPAKRECYESRRLFEAWLPDLVPNADSRDDNSSYSIHLCGDTGMHIPGLNDECHDGIWNSDLLVAWWIYELHVLIDGNILKGDRVTYANMLVKHNLSLLSYIVLLFNERLPRIVATAYRNFGEYRREPPQTNLLTTDAIASEIYNHIKSISVQDILYEYVHLSLAPTNIAPELWLKPTIQQLLNIDQYFQEYQTFGSQIPDEESRPRRSRSLRREREEARSIYRTEEFDVTPIPFNLDASEDPSEDFPVRGRRREATIAAPAPEPTTPIQRNIPRILPLDEWHTVFNSSPGTTVTERDRALERFLDNLNITDSFVLPNQRIDPSPYPLDKHLRAIDDAERHVITAITRDPDNAFDDRWWIRNECIYYGVFRAGVESMITILKNEFKLIPIYAGDIEIYFNAVKLILYRGHFPNRTTMMIIYAIVEAGLEFTEAALPYIPFQKEAPVWRVTEKIKKVVISEIVVDSIDFMGDPIVPERLIKYTEINTISEDDDTIYKQRVVYSYDSNELTKCLLIHGNKNPISKKPIWSCIGEFNSLFSTNISNANKKRLEHTFFNSVFTRPVCDALAQNESTFHMIGVTGYMLVSDKYAFNGNKTFSRCQTDFSQMFASFASKVPPSVTPETIIERIETILESRVPDDNITPVPVHSLILSLREAIEAIPLEARNIIQNSLFVIHEEEVYTLNDILKDAPIFAGQALINMYLTYCIGCDIDTTIPFNRTVHGRIILYGFMTVGTADTHVVVANVIDRDILYGNGMLLQNRHCENENSRGQASDLDYNYGIVHRVNVRDLSIKISRFVLQIEDESIDNSILSISPSEIFDILRNIHVPPHLKRFQLHV